MLKIAEDRRNWKAKKPLKRGGTEEAEELGRLPEVPRLPKIAENENQKPLQRRETDGGEE
jgi:hypothetical protein